MMRVVAGLLILVCSAAALAQPRVTIERIGFNSYYRPDCWTPMLVRIEPESGEHRVYQIQVVQEDLDGDLAVFTRTFTLTGTIEGQGPRATGIWTYFIPQPTRGGLSDSPRELQEQLRVYLADENGRRLAPVPVDNTIINADPPRTVWTQGRGRRLVLLVGEPGRAQPHFIRYDEYGRGGQKVFGIMEDIVAVPIQPQHLPESVLGYDAVDAIVWLNAPPPDPLRQADAARWRALRDYVRQGGRLIVCQPAERDRTAAFGEMLPVNVVSVEEREDIDPLRQLATKRNPDGSTILPGRDWDQLRPPFVMARAEAKPGVLVSEWMEWETEPRRTPYIARHAVGLGSVTWVAQDLGDPALTGTATSNWPHVWDRVFDWKNDTIIPGGDSVDDVRNVYGIGQGVDLAGPMLQGVEHGAKSAALILLALLFFMAYWAVAGPGVYLYLVKRRQSQMSWFAFALAAFAAAALTVVVVQLVLRGPPKVRHVTFVQQAAGEPAVVHSRIGLYIPRDGMQKIELSGSAGTTNWITPLKLHPQQLRADTDFPARLRYDISVDDILAGEEASVQIPYRSTLKKLEARWIGEMETGIGGRATLVPRAAGQIEGMLFNGTGRDLSYVYIAFRYPARDDGEEDWLLYLPHWQEGVPLDLNQAFNDDIWFVDPQQVGLDDSGLRRGRPTANRKVVGIIPAAGRERDWNNLWNYDMRGGRFGERFVEVSPDSADRVGSFFAMMSFFDRLPPPRRTQNQARFELLRTGARHLDRSHALSAGKLVVIAQADGPLPFPFKVADETITGEGRTYYQYVLPLDRSQVDASTVAADADVSDDPEPE